MFPQRMKAYVALTVLFALLAGTEAKPAAGNTSAEVLTCYTGDGRDYRGEVDTTISGKTCQRWSDQTPHKHDRTPQNNPDKGLENNYCRNPDGEPKPWCYTTDQQKRWEICPVSRCDFAPELTCYAGDGRNYRGKVATTISGKTCQSWSAQKPHKHSRTPQNYPDHGLDNNYCRNPDGEPKPWCYTTDQQKRWEFCQVPTCDAAPGPEVGGVSPPPSTTPTTRSPTTPPAPLPTPRPTAPSGLLTEADKEEIVNKHNELRRGVQPTASNMLKMMWNEEAAANAQRWADACVQEHSPGTERKISTSGCGENLYMSSAKNTWSDAIQAWYDEVKDWKYGEGSVNGGVVGHFTQVVWYRSNQIGCAVAHCPNAKYKYFYVCQYCSPGNYKLNPYKAGPSCGDCPNDCDDKLCTNPCPYKEKYSNCPSLKKKWGCSNPTIAGWCPASCKCTTEII